MRVATLWLMTFFTAAAFARSLRSPCEVKAQEIRLARECFTGDMHTTKDFGTFIGAENSKDDMNYCFNAFVTVTALKNSQVQFTVFKDGEKKGQLHIYNYVASKQKLSSSRSPASHMPLAVTFNNLKAPCFAKDPQNDKCSSGLFGFGSSDRSFTLQLAAAHGSYTVKGPAQKANLKLDPQTESDVAKTDAWLVQIIKQRLMTVAQRKLAMVSRHQMSRRKLGDSTTQFRYCRMALDGFVHARKLADPFSVSERGTLNQLEDHLRDTAPKVVGQK